MELTQKDPQKDDLQIKQYKGERYESPEIKELGRVEEMTQGGASFIIQ